MQVTAQVVACVEGLVLCESDIFRTATSMGQNFAVMLSASAGDFETINQSLSERVLSAVTQGWLTSRGSTVEGRMEAALTTARSVVAADAESCAWLAALTLEGDRVSISWLGGHQIMILNATGEIVNKSTRHIQLTQLSAEHTIRLLAKGIGSTYRYEAFEHLNCRVASETRIVVTSDAFSTIAEHEIAQAAMSGESELMRLCNTCTRPETPWAAAICLTV